MAKEYAKSFYKSRAWKKCRDGYMKSKYYICEKCGKPAAIVHHKRFITPMNINDPSITLSWDNLQALCADCHSQIHNRKHQITTKESKFDENGNLIKSPR